MPVTRRTLLTGTFAACVGGCAIDISGTRPPTANQSASGASISSSGRWVAHIIGNTIQVNDTRSPAQYDLGPYGGTEHIADDLEVVLAIGAAVFLDDAPTVVCAATMVASSELLVVDAPSGRVTRRKVLNSRVNMLAAEPGTPIVAATNRGVQWWDPTGDRVRSALDARPILCVMLAPDGRHAIVVARRGFKGYLRILDLRSGLARRLAHAPTVTSPTCIALSPGARRLAVDDGHQSIVVVDLHRRRTARLPVAWPMSMVFEGEDELLVASGGQCMLPSPRLQRWVRQPSGEWSAGDWKDMSFAAMRSIGGRIMATTADHSFEVDPQTLSATPTAHASAGSGVVLCG